MLTWTLRLAAAFGLLALAARRPEAGPVVIAAVALAAAALGVWGGPHRLTASGAAPATDRP